MGRNSGRSSFRHGQHGLSRRPIHFLVDTGGISGGTIYERMAVDAVARVHDVVSEPLPKGKTWLRALAGFRPKSISPGMPVALSVRALDGVFLRDVPNAPSVVIVHHLDYSSTTLAPVYRLAMPWIVRRLRAATSVVVVSQLWKRRLTNLGCRNVRVIYNAFDVQNFDVSDAEVERIRLTYGLGSKPIVYLGTPGPGKGVERAYQTLRGLDATLVCSGGTKPHGVPGLRHLILGYRDYLALLKASSIAVTMSEFEEGWCRVAHEAMLSGTPVVGSGLGGMRELLVDGGQVVCSDHRDLRAVVDRMLRDETLRLKAAFSGRSFARTFDRARFEAAWLAATADLRVKGAD